MIDRRGTASDRVHRTAKIRELIDVRLHLKTDRTRGLDHTPGLLQRKRVLFAKCVYEKRRCFPGEVRALIPVPGPRQHLATDQFYIRVRILFELRRNRVCSKERRDDVDNVPLIKFFDDAEHPELCVRIKPVTGLYLTSSRAASKH